MLRLNLYLKPLRALVQETSGKVFVYIMYNIEEISVFHISEHNFFMALTNLGYFWKLLEIIGT